MTLVEEVGKSEREKEKMTYTDGTINALNSYSVRPYAKTNSLTSASSCSCKGAPNDDIFSDLQDKTRIVR